MSVLHLSLSSSKNLLGCILSSQDYTQWQFLVRVANSIYRSVGFWLAGQKFLKFVEISFWLILILARLSLSDLGLSCPNQPIAAGQLGLSCAKLRAKKKACFVEILFWFSGKPSKLKHGGEIKIWFSPSTPELDRSLDRLRGGQLTPCPSAGWPSPLGHR